MKNNIKKSSGLKKAIKAGAIALGVVVILSIVLGLLGNNDRSNTFPGGQVPVAVPRPMGLPESSSAMPGSVGGSLGAPALKSADVVQQQNLASPSGSATDTGTDKKVVKNGDLELRVDSVDSAASKITQIAKDNGGDGFSCKFCVIGQSNTKSGNITVKVPVANYEASFAEIKKSAIVVISESTTGQDVTLQYTDLQAQLNNAQAEEQSYQKLLGTAQKIDDILSITQQLTQVRSEIESLQGQIKYMDSQIDMASISVNLTEDVNVTIVDSWRPWQVVKESFNALVKNVQVWVDFLIGLVILAIPVLLLYGLVILIFYKIGRKIYRKFSKKNI